MRHIIVLFLAMNGFPWWIVFAALGVAVVVTMMIIVIRVIAHCSHSDEEKVHLRYADERGSDVPGASIG